MATNSIIVFDTETGGLDYKKQPIMELALIVKNPINWEEIGRWESLIKNYNNLEYQPRALEVHGISISEANNSGIALEEFVMTMITIFKKFTPRGDKGGGKPILAGHNVMFDVGFLEEAFSLVGENLYKYILSNNGRAVVFDTIAWSKILWAAEPKHTLGECCKRAGLGDFTAHRAMPDVSVTCDLIGYFRDRLNNGATNTKQKSSEDSSREIKKSDHKIKFQM